jgi:hypothetical protein
VCCGEAVVEANLPAPGSWDGETKVKVGTVKITDDGKIVCHICGEAFKALWMHINRKHGIDADEYRAYFGLRTTEPLCGPIMYEERSDRQAQQEAAKNAEQRQADLDRLERFRLDFTREQRSLWSRNREQRLQAQGGGMGQYASVGAAAWQSRRRTDPDADRTWRGKLIVAKRRMLDEGTTCIVCGVQFCVLTSRAIGLRSPRKTCGDPTCKSEVKRRAQRAATEVRRAMKESRSA